MSNERAMDTKALVKKSTSQSDKSSQKENNNERYPFCIVWTPVPILTWFFPVIGHIGITTSSGIICDFFGLGYISEDNMAFGKPTKYWQLEAERCKDGEEGWDNAISDASAQYKTRSFGICYNSYTYVTLVLNLMCYNDCPWNAIKLGIFTSVYSKYVSVWGFLKQWLPFIVILTVILIIIVTKLNR